jgi:hypothetical protein
MRPEHRQIINEFLQWVGFFGTCWVVVLIGYLYYIHDTGVM